MATFLTAHNTNYMPCKNSDVMSISIPPFHKQYASCLGTVIPKAFVPTLLAGLTISAASQRPVPYNLLCVGVYDAADKVVRSTTRSCDANISTQAYAAKHAWPMTDWNGVVCYYTKCVSSALSSAPLKTSLLARKRAEMARENKKNDTNKEPKYYFKIMR